MRMQKSDFETGNSNTSWYDLREDWDLIESSLAKQYGIRIRQERDMKWSEFSALVSGLMADTPLGQIVAIRSEKDRKVIKAFTPSQRRIYNDWRSREAKKQTENPESFDRAMQELEHMFASMFGKGGET